MRTWFPVAAISLFLSPVFAGPTAIQVGDGQVDGFRIKPYQQIWRQCSIREGQWIDGGTLTETAIEVKDGERLLRVEQNSERPDGARGHTITHLVRSSLAPVRMETRQFDPEGHELGSASYAFDADGYRAELIRGEETQEKTGSAVTSGQFPGMNLGLVLAALDPEKKFPVELPASMIQFNAAYRVIATLAGREMLDTAHGPVEALMIDVEWHHLGQGDVYPGGPDASGGRYWVIPNPPAGVPYVPRYKTDTYAVEFVPGACPRPG